MPQRHLGNNTKFERLKLWNHISHFIHGLVLFKFFGHDTQQVPLGITIKNEKKVMQTFWFQNARLWILVDNAPSTNTTTNCSVLQ